MIGKKYGGKGKRRSVLKRDLSGTVLGEEGREAYEEDVISRRYAE